MVAEYLVDSYLIHGGRAVRWSPEGQICIACSKTYDTFAQVFTH